MGGICGIAFKDHERKVDTSALFPMADALDMSGKQQGGAVSFGAAGFATQSFNSILAGVSEHSIHGRRSGLAFYGSLFNLEEVCQRNSEEPSPLKELLQLYFREGIDFLQCLRGDFALAIWDGNEEALYLATDRFRVHPLFYYHDVDKLVFGSRMKGIRACRLLLNYTIDPRSLVDVLLASTVPTPRTIFHEVNKLPPGHVLRYHGGEVKLDPYWDINFLHQDGGSEKELAVKLKTHFKDAISIRLRNDRITDRWGTFLSGGIDSSTVTGVLTQLAGAPVKSFSIGFAENRFNEIDYARIAARSFAAQHHEHFVSPEEAYEAIPILLEGFDEPYANASAIPTYFCAKLAREHGVEVLYAGDGGDELFAGNPWYARQRLFEYYRVVPSWIAEPVLKPLIFSLARRWKQPLLAKAEKYIRIASTTFPERSSSPKRLGEVPLIDLLDAGLIEGLGKENNRETHPAFYSAQMPVRDELDRRLYIDLKLTISDNDLFKVTRMTEAAGVAVRFPFLDHRLAEFAATIPANVKMRGTKLRSFFKAAYVDLLPAEIRAKKKHGFGLPIPVWLKTDKKLNELMRDLVLSPQSVQRGYFRKQSLERLVDLHKADSTSYYGTVLWHLMALELWHRTYA